MNQHIFLDLQIDEIDQVFNSLNPDKYVSCPTGVGFCMAMSKRALQKVGILDDVSFDTMESKVCPGIYFAGEVLDIDAITGGFNFQAAWTTGFIAGKLN